MPESKENLESREGRLKPEFRVDEIENQEISDDKLDSVSGGSCAGCDRCGACYAPPDQSGGG